MSNYTAVREKLGYADDDRAFRDALIQAGINPREAQAEGLTNGQLKKVQARVKQIASAPDKTPTSSEAVSTDLETVSPTVVQSKLNLEPAAMIMLCEEFGLKGDQPIPLDDAMALCELAQERLGIQLDERLDYVELRDSLLFSQQQEQSYQIGYLEAAALGNAHAQGQIDYSLKRLGKRETSVRSGQQKIFSLLSQAGGQLSGKTLDAEVDHKKFRAELWS